MPALTQCWYTRIHVPVGRKQRESDGSYTARCRHCHKPITSWNKGAWYPADGFNISRLRDSTSGRLLYVIDVVDELIVAKYPIDHIKGVNALRDFKLEIRAAHGVDELGSTLRLIDSKEAARAH
ncbi:MAG: hypothetical protein JF595_01230 [Sphingomonadales bacterium]|nr:hypothetical protein [Sphingomonadales bacterium]